MTLDVPTSPSIPIFWRWFQDNEQDLFVFESDMERVFARLTDAMQAVHPELTFEFGPVELGKREFVISAGGIREAFPAVWALATGAPSLERWIVIPFRPRRAPGEIRFGQTVVRSSDVAVIPESTEGKVGIQMLIPGYRATPNSVFEQVGFLLLDRVLGEFDVETKLGYIEIGPRPDPLPGGAIPLAELPALLDRVAVN